MRAAVLALVVAAACSPPDAFDALKRCVESGSGERRLCQMEPGVHRLTRKVAFACDNAVRIEGRATVVRADWTDGDTLWSFTALPGCDLDIRDVRFEGANGVGGERAIRLDGPAETNLLLTSIETDQGFNDPGDQALRIDSQAQVELFIDRSRLRGSRDVVEIDRTAVPDAWRIEIRDTWIKANGRNGEGACLKVDAGRQRGGRLALDGVLHEFCDTVWDLNGNIAVSGSASFHAINRGSGPLVRIGGDVWGRDASPAGVAIDGTALDVDLFLTGRFARGKTFFEYGGQHVQPVLRARITQEGCVWTDPNQEAVEVLMDAAPGSAAAVKSLDVALTTGVEGCGPVEPVGPRMRANLERAGAVGRIRTGSSTLVLGGG